MALLDPMPAASYWTFDNAEPFPEGCIGQFAAQ